MRGGHGAVESLRRSIVVDIAVGVAVLFADLDAGF